MLRSFTTPLICFWGARALHLGLCFSVTLLPGTEAAAVPLQGQIEHTERLPSVDEFLRPGRKFDASLMQTESAVNFWVKIPHWLAGTWLIGEETRVYHCDYRTKAIDRTKHKFSARSRFSYGKQTDRQGNIWHYLATPYWSATEFPTFTEYHHVTLKEVAHQSSAAITFKTQMTVARVSKMSMKISRSFQQEALTKYTVSSDGQVEMSASTKVFDENGESTDVVDNVAVVEKASPYARIDYEAGKNLHELFCDFLISRGLTELVPN